MQLFIEDSQKHRINVHVFLSESEVIDIASDLLSLARDGQQIRLLCQRVCQQDRWLLFSLDYDNTREPDEGRYPIDADDI